MAIASNFPSIRPSLLLDFANVGRLDPRVTFTRASSGTYYDGVTTTKAEENLLLQSQTIATSPWAVSLGGSGTITTPTNNEGAAPDGTTTAARVRLDLNSGTATGDFSWWRQPYTGISGAAYTFSFWAKSYDGTSSYAAQIVDISNTGTAITITGTWTRFTVTANGTGSSVNPGVRIRGGQSPTNDDSIDILIWGAQLEQRSAVTAYTATTTQPITNYIPVLQTAAAGVARFDHNPTTGEALGLLIEEQRTNLITYSDDFANAAWTKTNSSVTSNTIVAPDGTLTGDKLVESATTAEHNIRQDTASQSAATYTFSIYAKAAERGYLQFVGTGVLPGQRANFDLLTGVTGSVDANMTANIEPVGNDWYRCSVTVASSSTGALRAQWNIITSSTSARVESYAGDGYSGLYLWGCDVEAGAFATSYIKTVAASATRNADAASMTGTNFSSWFNAAEGTVYVEGSSAAGNTTQGNFFNINDGTNQNRLFLVDKENATTFGFQVDVNGSTQANIIGGTFTAGAFSKLSAAYKVNDFAFYSNNASIGTDTVGTIPVVTRIEIGANQSAVQQLNGTIRKLAYYPQRLTNAQLQALTG